MKKIALVTGGGSGLGYCLSEELLKAGMDVCIVGRRENKLCEAQKELSRQYGERIQYAAGDISDEDFVKDLFLKLSDSGNYVQYLFNCAGTGQFGPAEENNRRIKISSAAPFPHITCSGFINSYAAIACLSGQYPTCG